MAKRRKRDPEPGKKPTKEQPDVLKHALADFKFASDDRPYREPEWDRYWRRYLVQARHPKKPYRSNAVSPHGGTVIRDLVPATKQLELSTRPFIRSRATKREVAELEHLVDLLVEYWFQIADVKHKVLTLQKKEALIFGAAFGIVEHVEKSRKVPYTPEEMAARKALGEPDEKEYFEVLRSGPAVIPVWIENSFPDPAGTFIDADNGTDLRFFIARSITTLSALEEDPKFADADLGMLKNPGLSSAGRLAIPIDSIFSTQRARILGMDEDRFQKFARRQEAIGDPAIEILNYISSEGDLIVIANQEHLLLEEKLDHPFPVYSLVPDPIPGQLYGKSAFHDAESTFTQRDFTLRKMYESVKNAVDQVLVANPGMVTRNQIKSRQEGVIWAADVSAVRELRYQNILGDMLGALRFLDTEMQVATGLSDPISRVGPRGAVYDESATTTLEKKAGAQAPIQEMVANLERGYKRIVRIMFDIEREYWSGEHWLRLAGEEGARWFNVDFDKIVGEFDFDVVGSQFAINKQNQFQALMAVTPTLENIGRLQPGTVDLHELARTIVETAQIPNFDRIVPKDPRDQGQEVENRVMQMGIRVKPDFDEDHQQHLEVLAREIERAQNEGDSEDYLALLMEHAIDHTKMLEQIQAQQQQEQALLAAQQGGQ